MYLAEFYKAKVFPDSLTNKVSRELKNEIHIKKDYFQICYQPLQNQTKESSIKIISENLFKENNYTLINVSFPGEIMNKNRNTNEKEKHLSKYDYLKNEIHKKYP